MLSSRGIQGFIFLYLRMILPLGFMMKAVLRKYPGYLGSLSWRLMER